MSLAQRFPLLQPSHKFAEIAYERTGDAKPLQGNERQQGLAPRLVKSANVKIPGSILARSTANRDKLLLDKNKTPEDNKAT